MMNGHVIRAMVLMVSLMLILLTAGCTQPASPTPVPTQQPTLPAVPSTQVPSPTPLPGSDEAHIDFTYNVKTYSKQYEAMTPLPGEAIYVLNVKVDSDKPVMTDDTWFRIEYQKNSSMPVQDVEPNTVYKYPSRIIGDGSGPATGLLIIALPAPEAGYQIRPYYYKTEDQQSGDIKVKNKYYGVLQ